MSITEDVTIINQEIVPAPSDFSWGAALVGAVLTAAAMLFLLTLGSGVGLALTTTPKLLHGQTPMFLTLGGIYFFAALAFSFALGAHVTGRLITPEVETAREESFRAAAHGLAVWAIATVATATMIGIGVFVTAGAAPSVIGSEGSMTGAVTGYWVDMLFRPASSQQASLDGVLYAQTDSGNATDAQDADQPPAQLMQQAPPATDDESSSADPTAQGADPVMPEGNGASTTLPSGTASTGDRSALTIGGVLPARNVMADKAEAGRILTMDLAKPGDLPNDDRMQLVNLVSLDTGLSTAAAQRRVDGVVTRIRAEETKTAETARKVTSYASLWTAFALLFGAIVSIMSAIAARHEDDRIRLFG